MCGKKLAGVIVTQKGGVSGQERAYKVVQKRPMCSFRMKERRNLQDRNQRNFKRGTKIKASLLGAISVGSILTSTAAQGKKDEDKLHWGREQVIQS